MTPAIEELERLLDDAEFKAFDRRDSWDMDLAATAFMSAAQEHLPAVFARIRSLEAENAALREAVTKSAAQFRYYEQSHREKGTSDGDHKAETNARFAMMCELAISEEQADG